MIFGAMLINDFLVRRNVTENKYKTADNPIRPPRSKVEGSKQKRVVDGKRENERGVNVATSLGIFLSIFLLMSASSFVSYTATVTMTPTVTSGSLWLYVNADDSVRTGWKKIGTTPYLDAIDYDANYLFVKGTDKEAGDFDFTNSGKDVETIENVSVQLYVKQTRSGDSLEVFVWNGSTWTSLGTKEMPTSWNWINFTASTELNSWTKIDGSRLYFVSRRRPGASEFQVDCVRLQVDYSSGLG